VKQTSRPRVGLVGAGAISTCHLPHLLRLGADVLVYAEAGADALVRRYGGTAVGSLDQLLDEVEIVDVATPTHTHHSITRQALERGLDVISEKPLARTDAEAADLLDLAKRMGCKLYPAHVVRYFPAYARLHEAVRSGMLGELAVLRFHRAGAFPARSAWFADPALSGGVILDQMIHDLDIARWLAGEVTTVSATVNRRGEGPVEAAHVLLSHASGAITHVAGVWGPAHLRFTTGYYVAGTGGVLEHDSAAEQGYVADLPQAVAGGEPVPDTDPAEDPYFLVLEDLMGAVRNGSPARVTAADGAEAVRIGNAAILSAQSGQPVRIGADS
jgi:myo-inositol 2-dehydrogenase/D-chiro-inositol 1-dehydrogenase